ncbi:hypothetical protein [Providencia stuartii]|uniref:hypothetical protein n=1 Tax=Providencia stuartii TaxID=588 RepID=UPI00264C7E99|nr:hypothetical protein [Providencia stuartii]MDN7222788.1 hypothetical protein [Providencia stuartii]
MNLSSQLDVLLCANSGSTRKLTHENANDVHLNGFNHRQLPLFAQNSHLNFTCGLFSANCRRCCTAKISCPDQGIATTC